MKKDIDKDPVGNFEGFFNPELLFCNDATVVDYLNALLESEPARNMDFKEIHFVHQEGNSNSNTTAIIGNTMLFHAEYSKTEVDELRSDNENLKFRTELAEIDAQVLRSENEKLKTVKEHLIAQLREMKEQLTTVRAENETMRQAAKAVHYRFVPPPQTRSIESKQENERTEPPPRAEMAAVEEVDHDSGQIDQCELTEPALQQEPQLEPVTVVEEHSNDYNTTVLSEQEREFFARANIPTEDVKTGNTADVTVFSRKTVVQTAHLQNAQPASKVMKHYPAEKHNTRQAGHIVKAPSPNEAPRDNNEAERRQQFVPQQQIEEVEKKVEAATVPTAIAVVETLKDVGEIDMPPAPASKVAIRRNVKNYEDVQKESDPNKLIEAGHDLVL